MDLASVAHDLYGLHPSAFTAARDSQAADAKSSGDAELAKSIRQLRRPTNSAWLGNLLVRQRPDEVDRLLALGNDMRRAQSRLEAKEMRALADERRKLVTALAKDARTLAGKMDTSINDSSIQELQATLEAAVSDLAASESLRSGNLTKCLEYSGFGPVDLTDAVAIPVEERVVPKNKVSKTSKTPPSEGKPKPKASPSAAERSDTKRHRAELALRDARTAHAQAERSARIEKERTDRATGELDRFTEQIEKLEKQISLLQGKAERSRRALEEAKKSFQAATRSERSAANQVSRAQGALDRI
jgi:hypothetical protein